MIDLEVTLFLCLLTSERGPFLVPSAVEGAREGAAGDKSRVSGTKEMLEGAGANKESGAVSRTEDASGGQVLLLARHASENALRTPVGCPQSVEPAVLRAFEDASRTRGACFWHRISLPYRRSLFLRTEAF